MFIHLLIGQPRLAISFALVCICYFIASIAVYGFLLAWLNEKGRGAAISKYTHQFSTLKKGTLVFMHVCAPKDN